MLNNISEIKGSKIVSVTTDGFITNIIDLENTLLKKGRNNTFLKLFRNIRAEVINNKINNKALEIKKQVLVLFHEQLEVKFQVNLKLLLQQVYKDEELLKTWKKLF